MIEVEKKYRLTSSQRDAILERLSELGVKRQRGEFEENTLYGNSTLDPDHTVLRLRRVGNSAVLTYKERFPSTSDIKHQREDEVTVDSADTLAAILEAIGFSPVLVYEKRRQTFIFGDVELVIDELPFGLFMEIEGSEDEIEAAEKRLGVNKLRAEKDTYPQLAMKHGTPNGDVIEARFKEQ